MTLILSAISPRWAMQASDRRVVKIDRAERIVDHEDERNKAIFVAERMTFAYTGHADIGGVDTAGWFQQRLATEMSRGRSIEEALQVVAEMLSQYFASLPSYVEDRGHAFVGVGWTDEAVTTRNSCLITVSNSVTEDGRWADRPDAEFRVQRQDLGSDQPCRIGIAGVALSDIARDRLYQRLVGQLTDGDDARSAAEVLIETIREVARSDQHVGPGVMVNSLPRAPGPPDGNVMLVGGLPERDVRTFSYVAAGGFDGRYLGPLVVSSDGMQMGNFVSTGMEVGPEGGSTGIMYRPSSAPPLPKAAVGQRVREYRIGRNDPCWCGSGKKYKRCHGG
jgi:hypothetical protein